jgi:hypothetical protein
VKRKYSTFVYPNHSSFQKLAELSIMKRIVPFLFLTTCLSAAEKPDLASRIPGFGCSDSTSFEGNKTVAHKLDKNVFVYKTRTNTYFPSVLFRIGMMDFDFQQFNYHVQSFMGQQFASVIPYAGMSYEFPIKMRKGGSFDNYIELNFLLPQALKEQRLLEADLSDISASIATGRDVAPTNKKFDLVIAIGLTGGRLHYGEINYTYNYAGYTYNQFYFGPQLSVMPKFIFGQLVIGARGSYRIDLLHQNWSGDPGADVIGPATASGWTAEVVIGIQLGTYY